MDVALENLPGKADNNAIGNVCSDADSKADATPKGVPKVQNPRYKTGTNLSGKRTECVRKLFSHHQRMEWRYILFSHSFSVSRYCRIYR